MESNDTTPDPSLTNQQQALIDALPKAVVIEIDRLLLAACTNRWQKVARVVGEMMLKRQAPELRGIPDIYYAQRVRRFVAEGALELEGDYINMRYSEVRLVLKK